MNRASIVAAACAVALVVPPARSQPHPAPSRFDVTVVAMEVSAVGCGHFDFVGSMRVRVDHVLDGPAPSGDVRVLAHCISLAPGARVRITARPMSPHHGSWGHFVTRHPIPVDSVPTFWATRIDRVPATAP